MPLHLLGKKSWNVYNTDNVARVRRDEAEAKLREEEEERRQQEIDSERRLDLLRGIKPRDLPDVEPKSDPPRPARRNDVDRKVKKRKLPGEDDTDRDIRLARLEAETSRNYKTVERSITDTSLKDQKGNINLFADERGRVEKNDEAEKEAQKKKREYEDQYTMRFSNAAGGREGVRTPWYSTTTQTPLDTSTKDVWGNDDPMRQKREQARNASNDPLAAMKKGVRQLKEAEKERAAWKAERDRETASLDPSSYSDLAPKSGTFPEALQLTSVAKSRFTPSDLYQRGTWLLSESLAAGVTSLRAFVEIDSTVEFKCLETAIQLKHDYADKCVIQICAFAQDPIFSGENGHKNLSLLSQALDKYGDEIRVLGTTPYVESSVETSHRNIDWAIQTALKYDLHLDFHLDYNLDETKAPMIWYVIDSLKTQKWPTISSWSSKPTTNPLKTIAVGHCTRLTLLPASELENLINKISTLSLPLTFIGLPTSDLYMMGRSSHSHSQPQPQTPMNIPRATLSPTYLLSLTPHKNTPFPNTALSINNISNPFTPSGSLDPLTLCSIGIGLYHAGTPEDTKTLYESVSVRARLGIGIGIDNDLFDNTTKQSTSTTLEIAPNTPINFIQYSSTNSSVAYYNDNNNTDLPQSKIKNPKPREKKSLQEIVWDPPFWGDRKVWFQR